MDYREYKAMIEDEDNSLEHYGVLGMHWGHHKSSFNKSSKAHNAVAKTSKAHAVVAKTGKAGIKVAAYILGTIGGACVADVVASTHTDNTGIVFAAEILGGTYGGIIADKLVDNLFPN